MAGAIAPVLPHQRRTIDRWAYGSDRGQHADVRKPPRRGSVQVDRIIFIVIGVPAGHPRVVFIVARVLVIVGVVEMRVIDVQTP